MQQQTSFDEKHPYCVWHVGTAEPLGRYSNFAAAASSAYYYRHFVRGTHIRLRHPLTIEITSPEGRIDSKEIDYWGAAH